MLACLCIKLWMSVIPMVIIVKRKCFVRVLLILMYVEDTPTGPQDDDVKHVSVRVEYGRQIGMQYHA